MLILAVVLGIGGLTMVLFMTIILKEVVDLGIRMDALEGGDYEPV